MGFDLLALGMLAAVLLLTLSLASFDVADPPGQMRFPPRTEIENLCGPVGAQLSYWLLSSVGFAAYLLVYAGFLTTGRVFARTGKSDILGRGIGWTLILFSLSMGLALAVPALGQATIYGSGGRIGSAGAVILEKYFSLTGGMILVSACSLPA